MRSNLLASFFNWAREVIESAETPFSKLVIFVLPALAPLVPAVITGIRLHDELGLPWWVSWTTSAVLEMLGYAGAIAFIRAIYNRVNGRGSLLSIFLNGLAYAFYVLVMYLINVRLGFLAGDSEIMSQIFALLSFITIPTGLLAAEHFNEREETEREREIRRERTNERLEKAKIKANARTNEPANVRPKRQRTNERTNGLTNEQLRIYQLFEEHFQRTGEVAGVSDLARFLTKEKTGSEQGYERLKGYVSEQRKSWWASRQGS